MAFTYALKPGTTYIEIILKGVMDDINEVAAFGRAVHSFYSQSFTQHILIDERELRHKLPNKHLLLIAQQLVAKVPSDRKFALVGSPDDAKHRDLFAGFAATLDFRMCSFDNIEEAKQWLQEP